MKVMICKDKTRIISSLDHADIKKGLKDENNLVWVELENPKLHKGYV